MISDILNAPIWSDWTISKHLACELASFLERRKPKVVLETGSGVSTLILARYAKQYHAQVHTLEHSAEYAAKTTALLKRFGTPLQVPYSPLKETDYGVFYRTALPKDIEFLLIDAPPVKYGREAVMPLVKPYLVPGATVWLDDAYREHEQAITRKWRLRTLPFPKGLGVTRYRHPAIDASDVSVTLLTGARPKLLKRTLDSLKGKGFLESAHVTCLHNGADAETAEVLDKYGFIDKLVTTKELIRWEGMAVSKLLKEALERDYHFHLEDDWEYATLDPNWLDDARELLSEVGQVRLRHRGEETLPHHQITKHPITWIDKGRFVTGDAHFTFNPALVTWQTAKKVFPANTENEAQRHFQGKVAQLSPGAFHHIGGNDSLRERC